MYSFSILKIRKNIKTMIPTDTGGRACTYCRDEVDYAPFLRLICVV